MAKDDNSDINKNIKKTKNKKETINGITRKKEVKVNKKQINEELSKVESSIEAIDKFSTQEVIVEKNGGFNLIEVILIMIITLFFGGVAGGIIVYTANSSHNQAPIFGDNIPVELNEFIKVYEEIKQEYYENLDEKKLLDSGIKGMIDYLGDPYSNYMTTEQTEAFNQTINGEYEGIGIELAKYEDGRSIIAGVFKDSPADKAGLKTGDQLIKIGNVDVAKLSSNEIVELIKNKNISKVVLTIKRNDKSNIIEVLREKIEIPSVISNVVENDGKKTGTLKINVFAANTFNQFEKEWNKLLEDNIDSLIIDVRDNSGGHLKVVEEIASLFVSKGKIIYQLETKGVKQPIYSNSDANVHIPVIILTNKASASASEILAAAMRESYGARIIGETTYGKGTVQTAKQLSSGATIKYTIQKWLTPNANWINDIGITPDVLVEQSSEYLSNPIETNDIQFQKALELLK